LYSYASCAVSLAAVVATCTDSVSSIRAPLLLNALTASLVEIAVCCIIFTAFLIALAVCSAIFF
jgi:hypothetical protein